MSSNQPIPQITPGDVERVVRRDFSDDDYASVMAILNDYGREGWHRESTRVQLAALKVANADVQRLRACIESAKRDYRDTLAAAEYPGYIKAAWGQTLPVEEKERIIENDWQQYQEWLKRPV